MTNESWPASDDPRRMLATSRLLAHRVRLAQRVTWFPLILLAAVTFVAIPVARLSVVRDCKLAGAGAPPGATACVGYHPALIVYWPVALTLAYAAAAYWYRRIVRARGLDGRVGPYVVAGIALTVLVTVVSLAVLHWALQHQPERLPGPTWAYRLGSDSAIGVALLVLAWLERNVALLLYTVAYLAVVVAPINFGWGVHWGPNWGFAPPLVIQGSVLLLGGLGFLLAQRSESYR